MFKGIILKILSEFSYVWYKKKVYECKSKGKLRHKNQIPIAGDFVNFEITDDVNFKGVISEILERKNVLYRPRIANIDQVIIITAVREPNLNIFTLNKYLVSIEYLNIKPILAFTKVDLLKNHDKDYQILDEYKKMGYEVYLINNMIGINEQWSALVKSLEKKVSVFTGQTGAGKSTTLNHIIPNLFEPTQEISKALNRGKHTTTKTELFIYKDGFIGDSPGFSSFEFKNFDKQKLAHSFTFFKNNIGKCKFNDCLHLKNSPNCFIIECVNENKFPKFIYEDYLKMQNDIIQQEKRKKY